MNILTLPASSVSLLFLSGDNDLSFHLLTTGEVPFSNQASFPFFSSPFIFSLSTRVFS